MSVLAKAIERVRSEGPKKGLASIAGELKVRVLDRDRTLVLLKVDLTDPANRVRPKDRPDPAFRLVPFDRGQVSRLHAMLEADDPGRAVTIRKRLMEGMRGFVAEESGAPIGYVFYTEGTDDPARVVHPDLAWLPLRPKSGEIYAFDYYLVERARGRGNLFVRSVQEEHHRLGYTAAYGYVLATNRAALWQYRTTGWKEIGRSVEHRLLGKWAVVDGTLYAIHPFSRTKLGAVPAELLEAARLQPAKGD